MSSYPAAAGLESPETEKPETNPVRGNARLKAIKEPIALAFAETTAFSLPRKRDHFTTAAVAAPFVIKYTTNRHGMEHDWLSKRGVGNAPRLSQPVHLCGLLRSRCQKFD